MTKVLDKFVGFIVKHYTISVLRPNIILVQNGIEKVICSADSDFDSVFILCMESFELERLRCFNWACNHGELGIVKHVISEMSSERITVGIRLAADFGQLEVIKYLVEMGGNVLDTLHRPIRWACEGGHLETVRYLIDQGCDLEEGLKVAREFGVGEVIEYLEFRKRVKL